MSQKYFMNKKTKRNEIIKKREDNEKDEIKNNKDEKIKRQMIILLQELSK